MKILYVRTTTSPPLPVKKMNKINHREYLVDVGYAAPFFHPIPLYLPKNYRLTFGCDRYILKPRNRKNFSELQLIRDEKKIDAYIIKPNSRSIEEFGTVIETSMKSTSNFMNSVLLAKYVGNSSVVIHNLTLIEVKDSNIHKPDAI